MFFKEFNLISVNNFYLIVNAFKSTLCIHITDKSKFGTIVII